MVCIEPGCEGFKVHTLLPALSRPELENCLTKNQILNERFREESDKI